MLKIQRWITALAAILMLSSAVPALAQNAVCGANDPLCLNPAKNTGLGTNDIRVTIASIIRVAMGLLGIVAVVIILIGGFTWLTSAGSEEKVQAAKQWIFAGVIGLAIILSAYALAQFVINSLTAATGFNPNP